MTDTLAKDFPHLADPAMAKAVVAAVWHVFEPEAHADQDQDDDERPQSTW